MPEQQPQINIKIEDAILKGAYANMVFASHNKEEFVLDFISVFGPQGIEVAKIITSPAHFKRIVSALTENLKKYEDQFGTIESVNPKPAQDPSQSTKFGF